MRAAALVVAVAACGARHRAAPPKPTPVVYFAMTDRFADGDPANDRDVDRTAPGAYHGGDLAGLRQRLDWIADLGAEVLWISPVVDNIDVAVRGAGFPDWGYHGYWARDFTRIDEHQGTEADLRALVDAAHARGVRVLLDVVLNHAGYDAPAAADPALTRSPARDECGADPLTECLYGLPDYRTEKPEVADALIDAHVGWLQRSGADGLRCDSARHVGLDVWRRLADRARAVRPDAFLLGEVWGAAPGRPEDAPYLSLFDALFDFSFADRAFAFVTGREDAAALARYLEARGPDADRYLVYLDTHDTPGFLFRAGGDTTALLLGAALQLTIPGTPLIYYGDEIARRGGEWPVNRSDMSFTAADGADLDVLARYKALLAARRAARLSGPYRTISADGRLLAFARGDTYIVINADTTARTVRLPGAPRPDLLRAAQIRPTQAAFDATIPARSAAIFPR